MKYVILGLVLALLLATPACASPRETYRIEVLSGELAPGVENINFSINPSKVNIYYREAGATATLNVTVSNKSAGAIEVNVADSQTLPLTPGGQKTIPIWIRYSDHDRTIPFTYADETVKVQLGLKVSTLMEN